VVQLSFPFCENPKNEENEKHEKNEKLTRLYTFSKKERRTFVMAVSDWVGSQEAKRR